MSDFRECFAWREERRKVPLPWLAGGRPATNPEVGKNIFLLNRSVPSHSAPFLLVHLPPLPGEHQYFVAQIESLKLFHIPQTFAFSGKFLNMKINIWVSKVTLLSL